MMLLALALLQAAYAPFPQFELRRSVPDTKGPYIEIMAGAAEFGASKPRVVRWPTAAAMAAQFPPGMKGIGYVTLLCAVRGDGMPAHCSVQEQEPERKPMLKPARQLVSMLRLDPRIARRVRIMITFNSGFYEDGDPCIPPVCFPTPMPPPPPDPRTP